MICIRNAKFAKIGLHDLVELLPEETVMVEIGCYVGDSSQIFAPKVSHMTCIDPWQNGYDDNDASSHTHPMSIVEEQFRETMSQFDNVEILKGSSEEAVDTFADGSLDFVYIDGLHTYEGVKNDIELWLPKVKKGGYIGGHDYGSKHHPGVKPAVDEMLGEPDKTFRDTSWLKSVK
jgi:predicted O-methyltransferase YrrM